MLRHCVIAAVLLLFLGLMIQRIWQYAAFKPSRHSMPAVVTLNEERRLFQTARGKYSLADIAANGGLLPSEKYRGFRAAHDYQPRPGDKLCPITRTKANTNCTWIVGGQTYQFCCPPCIAEFVSEAQDRPENIRPAKDYVELSR